MSTLQAASSRIGSRVDLAPSLFERSDGAGLARLCLHVALLGLSGWLVWVAQGAVWVTGAMLIHGVVLVFLFSPLHECIHRTAFARRWLNDSVAFTCGFLLLLPKEYFRCFHLTHHQYTQDPGRDPELDTPKPRTRGQYLLQLSGLPYWSERVTTLVRHAAGTVTELFIQARFRKLIVREARVYLVLYAALAAVSLYFQSFNALIYWVLPALLGQPFLRGFLLAEHTGCPLVPDMLKNSRTTRSNALVRLLTWNMPYHAEHHAWAALPFHALPCAYLQLKGSIEHQAPGYLAVHRQIWRQW